MNQDPWLSILLKLPLSRTEREVVRRYETDPGGRAFLPIADILRAHRHIDEALEVLITGVQRHPNFVVARVVLVRELFHKGLVEMASKILEESPVPLRDNVLAQKLKFKMEVLLGQDQQARATHGHLVAQQMLDSETRKIADILEVSGLEKAKSRLLKDLRERGVAVTLPVEPTKDLDLRTGSFVIKPVFGHPGMGSPGLGEPGQKQRVGSAHGNVPLIRDDEVSVGIHDDDIQGFHVVPLEDIFCPTAATFSELEEQDSEQGMKRKLVLDRELRLGPLELDSTTLAEIYAKQGLFTKALSVYKRLARLSPGNDLIRRKITELTKLEKDDRENREYSDDDRSTDSSAVDRLETLEIIDRQIKFYNDLLAKLP